MTLRCLSCGRTTMGNNRPGEAIAFVLCDDCKGPVVVTLLDPKPAKEEE